MLMPIKKSFAHERIWLVGASSGIGKALAAELAKSGAKVVLSSRQTDKLEKIANSLSGSGHDIAKLDVGNKQEVVSVVKGLFKKHKKIDRVIFLAGIYRPDAIKNTNLDFARELININLLGAIYLVTSCLPYLTRQDAGQIALTASVAGYFGLPNGQPYSASKAGLINLAETLRLEAPKHLDVKLINPGFVKTRLTQKNKFEMPFIISPEKAATYIAKGLQANGFEVHFPYRLSIIMKMIALMPYGLQKLLLNNLVKY